MHLSPYNLSAIKYLAGLTAAEPEPLKKPRPVTRWECPECGELHYCESDAEDCCQRPEQAAGSNEPMCPVCGTDHVDHYAAADCCLWKDLDIAARMKVAAVVEAGTDWATALNVK